MNLGIKLLKQNVKAMSGVFINENESVQVGVKSRNWQYIKGNALSNSQVY